ncbi:glycoside hydrolase [Phaffia rhodozyma]|uniref:Glycoside hydrolase n=1 Tax=Phaffia rhodozyma TaxID=264483 RepID=A0A0F7SEH1_PHARH|nr:glycoside hydrolase [Phaffia rhodozyma]
MFSFTQVLVPSLLLASSVLGRVHPRAAAATTTITVEATVTQTVYWQAAASTTAISTGTKVSLNAAATALAKTTSTTTTAKASSATAAATSTSTVGTGSSKPIVAAYYPDWVSMTPEQIDWTKVDWIDFGKSFAVVDSDLNIVFTDSSSTGLLTRAVKAGHAAGKKVKLSIGGWSGSTYFSRSVATADARTALVAKMVTLYNQYNLDGIDIDWEYPSTPGQSGNIVAAADTGNFLIFLQLLRNALPASAKITAATQVWPFTGTDGNPLSDVKAFAAVLDWISIMVYDVWGSSSTPGPNAPLSDGCGNSLQPLANAYAAVKSWSTAGFPVNQIVLATAAYGYISTSTATTLVERRKERRRGGAQLSSVGDIGNWINFAGGAKRDPHGQLLRKSSLARKASMKKGLRKDHRKRAWSSKRSTTVTLYNDAGGSVDGQIMFNDLIAQGALVWSSTTKKWIAAGGFTRSWDACSSTPFLRSSASGQVITYDDPDSLSLKAQFALQAGLGGVNVWDIHGDTSAFDLLVSLRSGLGLA